jgi:predicted AlkP superfamily pyrophosphatase or phosphodiesterase
MIFGLSRDFDKIEDVEDALNAFQSTGVLDQNKDDSATPNFGETTKVSYGFQSGKFIRKSEITDPILHQQRIDSLGESASFFESTAYILKINFPRPIVKYPNDSITEISPDKKTLVRQVSFLDYIKNPAVLDLEVSLEK